MEKIFVNNVKFRFQVVTKNLKLLLESEVICLASNLLFFTFLIPEVLHQ